MFEKRKETPVEAPQESNVTEVDTRSFKPNASSRVTATIGETICIEGTITGTENLIVNGTVNGVVNLSNHDLTIGSAGKIAADLMGKSVKVDGDVTGDITGSEVVVVSKSGQVRGNITAPRVTLEDGAKFKGSIDMDPVGSEPNSQTSSAPQASAPEKEQSSSVDELRTVDGGRA